MSLYHIFLNEGNNVINTQQVNRLLNALKNCTASMTLSVRQEIASYFVPELEAFVDLINELGR